jgi:heme/copper-type cytochrome/quinol oxidase subunit 2
MKTWFGVLMSAMLNYPLTYPGYLMPEAKQNLGTLKFGVNVSWVLLFICIPVLVLVFILFWRGAWPYKKKRMFNGPRDGISAKKSFHHNIS